MVDLSICEEKLSDIEQAEEELILHGYAHIDGVEITEANRDKLEKLKELWTKRKKEILDTPITVETCNRYIKLYLEAEEAILNSQSYTIDGRILTRANLTEVKRARREWEVKKEDLISGDGSYKRVYRLSFKGD